ncbi:MAG TPA: COX15/CtaA family protein [Gemmatimonadales bacterium]|nr:COX15/CtaA family protein [Gemmatimonadales bacterium]
MITAADDRSVRNWLIAAALAVVAAVLLTESGLSITVWEPVRGVLPPLDDAGWDKAYQQFLQIPQAHTVHSGITMAEFRTIFWWEWTHRLLARVVGLVLVIPYLVLLARKALRPEMRFRLALLPVLTLAQGALGWYMVSSGLSVRSSVSAYRLAAHLGLALVIWMLCIWSILDLTPTRDDHSVSRGLRRVVKGATVLAGITLISGALVAGLDAGLVFNTFPNMGDGLVPPGYGAAMAEWRSIFENPIVAQFHHRVLAIGTAFVTIATAIAVLRGTDSAPLRRAMTVAAMLVVVQVGLGIATLLMLVPIEIAVAHQFTGLMLLGAMTWAARRSITN